MESFLNRYRNITVLLLVIFAQLVLLAVDAKNDQHVRFIRVWTVTLVSPLARLMEGMRGSSIGFVHNYITLHDSDAENRRLRAENDRLKLDKIFLSNELNRAENAKALQIFQQRTPSKTLAASVFSTGIGSSRKVVYVDRGSVSGVMREMAVVTPDGIIGKVTAVYPTAAEVLLITDPMFAAGVVSAKTHAHGTLKGNGTSQCKVDFVAFEDKVDPGDWFYTSGDDRIFPRGMPVGVVKAVHPGQPYREITLDPAGMAGGSPDDVLIVLEGVHQDIPDTPPATQQVYLAPAPPPLAEPASLTAASEDIVLGGGPTGQNIKRPPDFTKIPVDPRTATQAGGAAAPAVAPVQPGVQPPAKKGTAAPTPTKSTAPATPPDAVRRANQAGGPGGIPQP
jgi:rod shape-determining protein MreC